MISLKQHTGVTLIEVLLVLVIFGVVALMGIGLFQQYQNYRNVEQIKANVDTLFQSLRSYYLANCSASRDYHTGAVINPNAGKLDPTVVTFSALNQAIFAQPVSIATDLVTPGYLTKYPFLFSNIAQDYVVQFNLYKNQTHSTPFCYQGNCSSVNTVTSNNIYVWTLQVAVKVNASTATYYQGLMGGNCVSNLNGSTVMPCGGPHSAGGYIVFERLPSLASTKANSPLWDSIPQVKLFNRQYTNDDYYAVSKDDATYFQNYENYLCGG